MDHAVFYAKLRSALGERMSLVKAALRWLRGIPAAVAHAREDLAAVRANDPAARSTLEVVLFYPGVHALWLHRVAHDLWTHDARSRRGRSRT